MTEAIIIIINLSISPPVSPYKNRIKLDKLTMYYIQSIFGTRQTWNVKLRRRKYIVNTDGHAHMHSGD